MSDGLTGPVKISKEDFEKWYHRLKNIAHLLHQRGYALGGNPKWGSMLRDMQERMMEDETWPHDDPIRVVISNDIAETDILPVDPETLKTLTLAQVNNSTAGYGRYKGLLIPQGDTLHQVDWRRKRNGN
jgi:hypothetical protein